MRLMIDFLLFSHEIVHHQFFFIVIVNTLDNCIKIFITLLLVHIIRLILSLLHFLSDIFVWLRFRFVDRYCHKLFVKVLYLYQYPLRTLNKEKALIKIIKHSQSFSKSSLSSSLYIWSMILYIYLYPKYFIHKIIYISCSQQSSNYSYRMVHTSSITKETCCDNIFFFYR